MGDGRYYTFYQFWGIFILVILSIFIFSSMIIGYYRNRGNKNDVQLLHLFLGLAFLSIIKIVEFVIPNIDIALFLRGVFITALLALVIEWFNYLNSCIFQMRKFYNRYFVWSLILILAIVGIITKGSIFFSEYQFFKTTFSLFYLGLCVALLVLTLFFVIELAISKKQVHKVYQNRTSIFMLLFFDFCPILFYVMAIATDGSHIDFFEINLLIMLAISFNMLMYSQAPSGITVLTFEKIGDIVNDYILVTDLNGKIIYRNESVQNSSLFIEKDALNLDKIEELYDAKSTQMENSNGDKYIQLIQKDQEYFFAHQIDPLKNQKEIIGYIITIIDITELMELLHLLEEMKTQAKEVNEQLMNYAEVVYNVEKEKQINILLENILSSREDDVKQLTKMIDELIKNEKSNALVDMQKQINYVIKYNQKIIDEVRKTVNSYR